MDEICPYCSSYLKILENVRTDYGILVSLRCIKPQCKKIFYKVENFLDLAVFNKSKQFSTEYKLEDFPKEV